MKVLMFMPQFAPLVRDGLKLQTVRPNRKIPIKVGDELSLRQWSGTPYASPQIILKESVCTKTEPITIESESMDIFRKSYDHQSDIEWLNNFSRADGFECFESMVKWFTEQHSLPFSGTVIYWK